MNATQHDALDRVARYAPDRVLDPGGLTTARAAVERGIADPTSASPATPPRRPQPRRRRGGLRWAVPAAAAVCGLAIAGGLALKNAPQAEAFPGWSAVPQTPTAAGVKEAATICRASLADNSARLDSSDGVTLTDAQIAALQPVLVDKRGPWVYTELAGGAREASCLSNNGNVAISTWAESVDSGDQDPERARGHFLVLTEAGLESDDGPIVVTSGVVAADVAGVSLHVYGLSDVTATVKNGRFVAWAPASGGEVWPEEAAQQAEHAQDSYTVTYTDGTVQSYLMSEISPTD